MIEFFEKLENNILTRVIICRYYINTRCIYNLKKLTPEELLGLIKFAVDEEEPHIVLDKTICAKCVDMPCLVVWPAVLYTLKDGDMK